jgi:PKD repeat protein/DNA-binding beta-propeller fold protein YncE
MKCRLNAVVPLLAVCALALPANAEVITEAWRSPFGVPRSVSTSLSDGSCWVAAGGSVLHLDPDGTVLGQTDGFWTPWSVSADSTDGSCWVADSGNNEVVHLSSTGAELWRGGGFSEPYCVSVNPTDGSCWVADYGSNQVVHLASTGAELWRGGAFSEPLAVSAVPSDGSCWLADAGNNQVVRLASTGEEMWRGGGFSYPYSVSADPDDGSCWVADTYHNQVVHLAGSGTQLWRGGGFVYPLSVSVDASDGSCWVADYANDQVVHLSNAGAELQRESGFYLPTAVSADPAGSSCWVGDYGNSQVVYVSDPDGELWRGGGFSSPQCVSVNATDGSSWIADTYNHEVVHLAAEGTELWRGDGFYYPTGVSVNPNDGSCWVADTYDNEVVHLSSAGAELWRGGGFLLPGAVAVDPEDGSCWVADSSNDQVVHLSSAGEELWRGDGFVFPVSVAVGAADGSCWVAISGTDEVAHLSRDGEELWRGADFLSPNSVSVDSADGSCWVADSGDNQVVHLSSDGEELWRGGAFSAPRAVSADESDGSCWVTDTDNGQIVYLSSAGVELWRGGGFADSRSLSVSPSDGSCWVADTGDSQVVRLSPVVVLVDAGPDRTIAVGGSAVLEGSVTGGTAPYTYSWSPTTGLSDPAAAQPLASPAVTTTYTLTVTDDLGESGADAVVVTVASAVVADAGPDRMIGAGGSATLAGSAAGGVPPYGYSWSPPTGLSDPAVAQPLASPDVTTEYTLTVTDDLGQVDADAVVVTVVAVVTAEAGPDKVIEGGGSTTLEGSAAGGAPPYSYSWLPASGLDDPSVARPVASPTSTVTYTLTVTDDVGQTATDTVTVTVLPPFQVDPGPGGTIAAGGSIVLHGSAAGGLPPYSFVWSPTDGLSDPTSAETTASPSATTVYTLTATDSLGAFDSGSTTVVVASAVAAEAGPGKEIAAGGAALLEGSASGGLPPYTYSWSPATGLSDPGVAQPEASPEATTIYTLTVTDSLAQTGTDTVTVTVIEASAVVAEAGPDKVVAAGHAATLEGSASGGLPPYTYSWSPATGLSDPGVAQPEASPGATTTYTLMVTDSLAQADTDTVMVTVASAVTAEAGPDKTIAPGGAALLEGSASGGLPPYTYSWSPATGLSDPGVAQPEASPAQTTTYTLTVADSLHQTGTDAVIVTVTAVPAPVANFAAAPTIGTAPLTVTFTDASSNAPTSWSWDFGDGSASTGQHPTHDYAEVGAYTVALTVGNGIGWDTERKEQYILVTFPDVPFEPEEHWALRQILACVDAGIVQGYPSGNYEPTDPVTRAQMAVYIARAIATPTGDEGVPDPPEGTQSFTDVAGDHWAYRYVEYCAANGIVQGYPDGGYRPGEVVNRGQMSVYIARAVAGGDGAVPEHTGDATFTDVTDVNEWAWCYRYVEYCAAADIVQGYWDGSYRPADEVTRDQMAVYVARAFALPM